MKRIKSILSFILVFFLTISFLPTTGVYAKLFGSGGVRDLPEMVVANPSAIGDTGLQDFYRVTAVPIDTSRDAVTPFLAYSSGSKKVKLRKQVPNYPEPEDWWYFTTEERSKRAKVLYQGSVRTSVKVHGTDDSDLKKFMKIIGVSSYTNDWAVWDKAIKSKDKNEFDSSKSDNNKSVKLLKFLLDKAYDGNTKYYFVFERVKVFKEVSSSKTVYTLISRQDYRYSQGSRNHIYAMLGKLGTLTDSKKRLYDNMYGYDYKLNGQVMSATTDGWLNQGNEAPFGVGFLTGGNGKYGYAVYAGTAGDPPSNSKTTLNITVEYQGNVGQEKGTIHTRSSFIKNDSEYWKVTDNTYKSAKGDAETLLRLRETDKQNKVRINKPYTMFAGRFVKLTLSKEQTFTDMLKELKATFNTSRVKWESEPLTGKNVVGVKVVPKHFITDFQNYLNSEQGSIVNNDIFSREDITKGKLKSSGDYEATITDTSMPVKFYKLVLLDLIKNLSGVVDSPDGIVNNKGDGIVAGKPLGVSISYLVKAEPVTSNKATIKINIDKRGKAKITTVGGIVPGNYTNLDQYNMPIAKGTKVLAVVPYKGKNAGVSELIKKLSGVEAKDLKDAGKVAKKLETMFPDKEISTAMGIPSEIALGCQSKEKIEGYTVYEILINAETPTGGNTPDPASGKVELPAYMLNRYFPNIINTSSDGKVQYQVGKDFTVKKELYKDQETCPRCGSTFFPITQPNRYQDWNIEWRDQSSSGYHIALDNKNRDRYFPSMPNGVWGSAKRSVLASWTSQNTEGWSDPSGKIIDYGFNLIRASVKDNKALSGIAYKTYDVVDKDNVLQFKPYFGVSPVSSPLKASSLRSSMALAGKVSDTITVASRFTRYHGSGFDEKLNHHFEPEIGHTECGKYSCWWVVDEPEVNIYWYSFPTKIASGIRINGSSANSFTYTFESNVRKYQTATMDTGENEKISGGSTAVNIHAFSPKEGEVADGNEYRFANVRYNGVTHNFYPEVNMVYKIDGTQYDGNSPYRIASTMGEVLRKSKSSSLYLFKLNGVGQTTTGVTYSDSALGGTVSRGSRHVVIPAGADVHIKAEPKNITLDLYGYALDSINADTDSTFKPEKFTSHKYTDIVASGRNVDTEWNGKANRPALIKHFSDWTDNILDIRNFSADFELHVNGIKKASNFSAVVGDIKRNKSITEDGVYQLQFKKGSLLSNRDYSLLIKQIASDYQCSESEAEGVFKASGIYTSILNAIESSTSDINNSGQAKLGQVDWTNDLGSDGNWYDEYVNTFVVRRFTNKGNKINSITATDKIDYGLAPDGSERRLQNANYNRVNRAFWKLSIFFNPARAKEVKDLLVGRGSFYDPSKRWSKLSEARDSFTVLMHGVRVQRADFGISADSTKEF
ncbi:MAG: hypothetical protein ACTTG8_04980 [Catonella sp.]|uniref:hypothetical protein n=1 Tax=Catonella sp. TaxID=2382125 RepID=UPI003F9EDFE2